jgi:hypothetical protein
MPLTSRSCTALAVIIFSLFLLVNPGLAEETGERDFAISLYGGVHSEGNMTSSITPDYEFTDNYIVGASFDWKFARWDKYMTFELEPAFMNHMGDTNYQEFTFSILFRWVNFFWNDYVRTSFAVGEGVSYATVIPPIEGTKDEGGKRFLNLLTFELTLGAPSVPQLDFLIRMHHRSAAWGLYGDNGESNFILCGLRFNF